MLFSGLQRASNQQTVEKVVISPPHYSDEIFLSLTELVPLCQIRRVSNDVLNPQEEFFSSHLSDLLKPSIPSCALHSLRAKLLSVLSQK